MFEISRFFWVVIIGVFLDYLVVVIIIFFFFMIDFWNNIWWGMCIRIMVKFFWFVFIKFFFSYCIVIRVFFGVLFLFWIVRRFFFFCFFWIVVVKFVGRILILVIRCGGIWVIGLDFCCLIFCLFFRFDVEYFGFLKDGGWLCVGEWIGGLLIEGVWGRLCLMLVGLFFR